MKRATRLLALCFALAAAGAGTLFAISPSGADENDRGILANVISKALSSPGMTVSVGKVDGALSSNATISDITIADAQGTWLHLDRAKIVWTRSALLLRRLSIDDLEIGKLEILRKPVPVPGAAPPANDGPLLPELPVKVEIAKFFLADLALGQDILGIAAHLSANGHAKLGNPSEGLDLDLSTRRTDAPGTIDVQLSFVPQSKALKLKMAAHEPPGGIIAHVASLPASAPFDLDLTGDGTLDSFAAKLDFAAGPDIGATGTAQLARQNTERVLNLDAAARVEGLLPTIIGPVFAGATRLGGAVHFGDDGAINADGVSVVAAAARLDINGGVDATKNLDARLSIQATGEGGRVRAAGVDLKTLALEATAKGTVQAPHLAAHFVLDDAKMPAGRFGHVEARVDATPNGPVADAATRIDLTADATGTGLALADAALARAVGDRFAFNLRGRLSPAGDADISVAHLAAPAIDATYAGMLGPQDVNGHLALEASDLSRFADLAGIKLAGTLKGTSELSGKLSGGDLKADVTMAADRLSTGIAPVDGLTGGHVDLKGAVTRLATGGVGFSQLALTARHMNATVDGNATPQAADVTLQAQIPDTARALPQLAGRADATAHMTGTLDRPDASASIRLTDATAMGRPIPRLWVNADVKDLLGALDAHATLDGEINRKAASGAIALARTNDGGWRFQSDNLTVGSVSLAGNAAIDKDKLANGRVTVKAADLDDLSPLVLQKLSGRLDADIGLDAANGSQSVNVSAHGSNIHAASAAIDRVDVEAHAADLYGKPTLDGTAAIDRAVVGGETLGRLRAQAKASPQGGSDLTLSTELRGFTINARAGLRTADKLRLDLASFDARRGALRLALANPASFTFPGKGVEINSLALTTGGGRLSVNGSVGDRLDLTVAAKSLPLSLAALAKPDLALEGTLDADARLSGTPAAPTGDWKLHVARLVAAQTRGAGVPPIDVNGSGRLEGTRATVDATATVGRFGSVRAAGSVPLSATGSLDVAVKGAIDAAIANTTLSAGGRSLTGKLTIDARAQGSATQPRLGGTASLSNGKFVDPVAGVRLDRLELVARAQGDQVTIERASATTPNGGQLTVGGHVRIAPDAGFPAQIRVTANRAQLVSNPTVTAVGDLALDLSGPLARRPRIAGKISLDSVDVRVPDRLPSSRSPLPGTIHVKPTRAAAQRLAVAKKQAANAGRRAPPFDADLDLTLSAPSRIFVRGRGIDAELGGDLRLHGTLGNPIADGGFDLRRGQFSLPTQKLDFTRGKITFAGNIVPDLDFVAQTTAADVTAQIVISGPASQPTFAFTSSPSLPPDEVMSRILFANAAGNLSPIQALQVAQTIAELSGNGGPGVLDNVRKSLGVDTLNVGIGANGGATVGASRYISKNVNVGVQTGSRPEDSAVSVGVDITHGVRAQSQIGADGKTSVGVGFDWEY